MNDIKLFSSSGGALHPKVGFVRDAGQEEPAHLPHQQLRSHLVCDIGKYSKEFPTIYFPMKF